MSPEPAPASASSSAPAPAPASAPAPPRGYAHALVIPTRWGDNDVYGHVNNVEYYAFFDTVINSYLIHHGGLDIHGGEVIGLCAESHCRYHAGVAFPDPVTAALRVGKLSTRSVTYEIALHAGAGEEPIAEGWFVHVFVDARSRRPTPIPERLRDALARLIVSAPEEESR